MSYSVSAKWVLAVACLVGMGTSGAVFAHGGGGHGGGGHGGGHSGGHGGFGGGHYGGGGHHYGGGYGGYGGYGLGIGLGYGLGYGGYYGGYGGYGGYYGGYPGYGYGGYGGYYAPTYTNYTQPVYSQPVYSNSIYTGSSTVVTTPQVISSSPQVTYDGGEIVLFSPPTNTQEAQYTLNGMAYAMKPGTVQRFRNDRNWTIEVNTGNGQYVKYTLSTGRYKFKPADTGMGLFTTMDQPESVNTNPTPSTTPTPAAVPVAPIPMPVQ